MQNSLQSNITKLYLIKIAKWFMLTMPILMLFYKDIVITSYSIHYTKLYDEKGYFKKEEANISQINQLIKRIETSGDYLKAKEELNSKKEQSKKELSDFNSFMKTAKKNRKTERELAKVNLSTSDFEIFSKKLVQESLKHSYNFV